MKLLTYRTPDGHRVGRVDGEIGPDAAVTEVPSPDGGAFDVGRLLGLDKWQAYAAAASGPTRAFGDLDLAPVVPEPSKVLCVGLNYRNHILEMGRDLPDFPTLFAKFPETLTGPHDAIALPPEDDALDWEAELTVVIGRTCRRVTEEQALDVIAGYTVANDISMRTWQFRTKEWLQGKMWEASTPVGPCLVTSDEWQPGGAISASINGETMQDESTGDLVFDAARLVAYASTMITLNPGDLILTGTPGGVGRARKPPRFLVAGDRLTTRIEGLGELSNTVVDDPDTAAYVADGAARLPLGRRRAVSGRGF